MKRRMTVLTIVMMLLLTCATLLTGQLREEPFDIGDFSHVNLPEVIRTFEETQTNEDLVLVCKTLCWQIEVLQKPEAEAELNHYGQLLLDRAKAETVDLETVDDPEVMLDVLRVIRSTGAK